MEISFFREMCLSGNVYFWWWSNFLGGKSFICKLLLWFSDIHAIYRIRDQMFSPRLHSFSNGLFLLQSRISAVLKYCKELIMWFDKLIFYTKIATAPHYLFRYQMYKYKHFLYACYTTAVLYRFWIHKQLQLRVTSVTKLVIFAFIKLREQWINQLYAPLETPQKRQQRKQQRKLNKPIFYTVLVIQA